MANKIFLALRKKKREEKKGIIIHYQFVSSLIQKKKNLPQSSNRVVIDRTMERRYQCQVMEDWIQSFHVYQQSLVGHDRIRKYPSPSLR